MKVTPKRIFVIDDETTIADSVSEILVLSGFNATPFYSGYDALEFARKKCPDFVLSDVLMPRLNGMDTAVAIRQLCPYVRVLLFSGQAGSAELLAKARAEGNQFELLPKPIHPDELIKRLSTL